MVFFRFFMYILEPSNERLRKKANGGLNRVLITLYQFLLRWLMKCYKHYAIADTISIDNGRIKIIHEQRDIEFENELARNKIDIRPHFLTREIPLNVNKGKYSYLLKYFHFKDITSVYVENKELFVKHDHTLSIDGNALVKIKSSSSEDIIARNIIDYKLTNPSERKSVIESPEDLPQNKIVKRKQQDKNNLFAGEKIRVREGYSKEDENTILPQNTTITKRGFDIDTSF